MKTFISWGRGPTIKTKDFSEIYFDQAHATLEWQPGRRHLAPGAQIGKLNKHTAFRRQLFVADADLWLVLDAAISVLPFGSLFILSSHSVFFLQAWKLPTQLPVNSWSLSQKKTQQSQNFNFRHLPQQKVSVNERLVKPCFKQEETDSVAPDKPRMQTNYLPLSSGQSSVSPESHKMWIAWGQKKHLNYKPFTTTTKSLERRQPSSVGKKIVQHFYGVVKFPKTAGSIWGVRWRVENSPTFFVCIAKLPKIHQRLFHRHL